MRKRWMNLAVLIILLTLVGGCASEETNESAEEIKPIPIELATAKKDMIEHTYTSIGEVVPKSQVDLYVNGNGYIEKVYVSTGDIIEEGQLVIQLDDNDYDWSTYNSTESQLRTARDEIAAQIETVKENLEKQQVLFTEGIVTNAEIDTIQTQLVSLERQYNNAQVAYKTQLSALYESLEDSVKNRTIYSSIKGKVALVNVKEGQAVLNQLAVSIIDDTELYVKTFVSGDLKKQLAKGDGVNIDMDTENGSVVSGYIYEINKLPDINTKLFEVLVKIEEEADVIIGDYAEVQFILERYEAYMIPTRAVIRSGAQEYIYTYKDERVSRELIETGRSKGEWVEVKEVGQPIKLVVKGQNQISDNSDIVVIK